MKNDIGYLILKNNEKVYMPENISKISEKLVRDMVFEYSNETKKYLNSNDSYHPWVKEVYIPNSVIEIESDAFLACENLKIVRCSEESILKVIGDNAFEGCINLEVFIFPSDLCYIGCRAFRDTGLKTLDCSNIGHLFLGDEAFSFCEKLVSVEYFNISTVPYGCFSNCSNLLKFDGSAVQIIEDYAFNRCNSLVQANWCYSKFLHIGIENDSIKRIIEN